MATGVSTITSVAQAARQPPTTAASNKPNHKTNYKECLAKYGGGCTTKLPEVGTILAPWVKVEFEGSGSVITVGNDSSPSTDPRNVACIKSFEFGHSDGMTVRVVIHDEQGGSFVQFMEHLFKHFATLKFGAPANVRMKFQFGWCKSDCHNAEIPSASSREFFALCDSVETNFSEGKIIFELTGKDLCHRMLEGGVAYDVGGEGKNSEISLKDAITQLMTNKCAPCIKSVKFKSIDENSNTIVDLVFEGSDPSGPKGKWNTNGQTKLEAVRRWLNSYKTKNGHGTILQYNPEEPGGELIIWEDRKPSTPQSDQFFDRFCIGTYIVNGGQESSVIEFNPRIKWDFSRLTNQGGGLSGQTANALKTPGSTTPGTPIRTLTSGEDPCAGQNTQSIATDNLINQHNKTAVIESQKANAVNVKAMKVLNDNIEADLVIIGDPVICPPSESVWSKTVTIILVNPYFLTVGSGCGDFLAKPVCNEILSNKGWFVKSVTHKIDSGKYTTTLGVYLSAPGIDLPADAPLGGWVGGWIPLVV